MDHDREPRPTGVPGARLKPEPLPGEFDPANPDHVGMRHRHAGDPRDPLAEPERRQTVDNYEAQVRGGAAGSDSGGGRDA